MSRIGNQPVELGEKVKAKLEGQNFIVEGPKGKLEQKMHPRIKVALENGVVTVKRASDLSTDKALHGLIRSLIRNMVVGVTEGYVKELELEGVGYKAQLKGKVLNLALGYTHPIDYPIPADVDIKCPKPTQITVSGLDKQRVGQVAAEIRKFHKPEPYKGKGIHYVGETIRRKQGKKVG